ncbi:MAG: alpha-glucosidase/alpha-galactosidase [Spirochaetaceae bacterium]|nr:MAG: alpha-glucosidase/alpha-galactosidase [Spirochaetaceae bacterium]
MVRIAFVGAGSTVFAKNILGDILLQESLHDAEIRLYDIDGRRLADSQRLVETLNKTINGGRAAIRTFVGSDTLRDALRDADFVINAIQVGGYDPGTIRDFELPRAFNLRQTIGDTLGIGGIFRGLRTIPPMREIAAAMAEACPSAWLLNYTNPMAICTGAILRETGVKTVGLCHSVQRCATELLRALGMECEDPRWDIAGINHMAWLLTLRDGERDIYPEARRRAREIITAVRRGESVQTTDLVRIAMLDLFGYYVTESSEHNAEYTPWWIKTRYPELIERYRIPLDEYPRRCREQIAEWEALRESLLGSARIDHERTIEYAADIIHSITTGDPALVHGNILNNGHISNLPERCVVEVPCLVDGNGLRGTVVGDLPEQCAALNRTNVNVHLLTMEASRREDRAMVYQAAALDPLTAAELSLDDIVALCDALFEAHRDMLPAGFYR